MRVGTASLEPALFQSEYWTSAVSVPNSLLQLFPVFLSAVLPHDPPVSSLMSSDVPQRPRRGYQECNFESTGRVGQQWLHMYSAIPRSPSSRSFPLCFSFCAKFEVLLFAARFHGVSQPLYVTQVLVESIYETLREVAVFSSEIEPRSFGCSKRLENGVADSGRDLLHRRKGAS